MAEKDQAPYPLAPANAANGHVRSDEEAATEQARELKRKKRMKWIIYGAAFTIFQIFVITAFVLVVLRFKSPKFRVRSGSFTTFNVGTDSFNLIMDTQFTVKNTNYGHFKYQASNVTFLYRDTTIGHASVWKAKARAKATRKFNEIVSLSSVSHPQLANDISSGILPLTSQAKLNGKLHLFLIMKKKKSSEMNCTMEVNIATKSLQNIVCQ